MAFVYEGGAVSEDTLHEALEFMISLEPDESDGLAKYDSILQENKQSVEMAYRAVRQYGEQIEPKTLDAMQKIFYSVTNSSRYSRSATRCSVARAVIESAWDGVGPWRQ